MCYGSRVTDGEACKPLKENAVFVERVRMCIQEYGKEEGIKQAIDSCIKDDILREILSRNKAEVIGMTLTEYDEQEQMELVKEEGRTKGMDIVNRLILFLIRDGRMEEIERAASDAEYRDELMKYYGMDK